MIILEAKICFTCKEAKRRKIGLKKKISIKGTELYVKSISYPSMRDIKPGENDIIVEASTETPYGNCLYCNS